MTRGRFITVEGGEGVGKSTSLAFIRAQLAERGIDVLTTREPGGTPLAEEVRALLLARRDEAVSPLAETLLIFAARAQHLAATVEPALAAGRWVLCDRFTDSTFAYQGGGRGVSEQTLAALAAQVHADRWPDLTLYFDMPVAAATARLGERERDRFEREPPAFFERARSVFRQRARRQERMVEIDAAGTPAQVQAQLKRVLDDFLAAHQVARAVAEAP